jgi:hypothetical protein
MVRGESIMNGTHSHMTRKISLCSAAFQMVCLVAPPGLSPASAVRSTLCQSSSKTTAPPKSNELRFARGTPGDLIQDGEVLGFTTYKASNGVGLTSIYNTFDEASHAAAFFEKELGLAAKVITRGEKINKDGKVIGERAEILLPKPNEKLTAVMWTDGRNFHEIDSTSLEVILEFEKGYKY